MRVTPFRCRVEPAASAPTTATSIEVVGPPELTADFATLAARNAETTTAAITARTP